MQNHTLPIQLSPAAIAPMNNRAVAQPAGDAALFSQTLQREVAQRQPAPAAPAPARPAQQAKAPAAPKDKPASAAPADASADKAAPASADAGPDGADAEAAQAVAQGAAAAAPVTDMLALVASYQQLMAAGAAPAPAPAAAPVADAPGLVSNARLGPPGADASTLAALQGAVRKLDSAATAAAGALPPADSTPHGVLKHAAVDALADDAGQGAAPTATRALQELGASAPRGASAAPELAGAVRDALPAAGKDVAAPVTGAFQAQLSSLEMAQTAVSAASDRLPARVGSAAWDTQLSQKVVWMVAGKDQSASLTLNPPDLGPLQVVLNVNNDQATVSFTAAEPEVRQALEDALPRLREMLGEAGIALGDASVGAGMPQQHQAGTFGQGGGASGRGQGAGNGRVRSGETVVAPAAPRGARAAPRDDGAVDTFA